MSRTFTKLLAPFLLGLALSGPAWAGGSLEAWRDEAAGTRKLAENDIPRAYEQAKRLQAALPADAAPADRARLLNLLARIEVYLALTDAADKNARAAKALAKRHGDAVGQIEADLNLALSAVNQARIDEAVAATTDAMNMLEGVDRSDLLAETMLRTAMMHRRLGHFDDSVTLAMQTMDIARRGKDPLALTYAYQGLAITYDLSGRKQEARQYFIEMRDQARAAGSRLLEADALLGLGGATAALGDVRAGEMQLREAVAIYRSAGGPFYVAHGLYILADTLGRQQRYAVALPLFDEAAAIYERHHNKIALWWTYNARSENRQALGRLDAARADAEHGHALAKEIGLPVYLGGSAKRLAALAAARGDHRQAYAFAVEAAEMADRITRQTTDERMIDLAERYQAESRQREIGELTRRNERQALQQRLLATVVGAAVLMLLATGFFLVRQRRGNRLLSAVNTQLERWHDIFEHAEWGVAVGSGDGRTLELMNPAFARMHGYTVEELTGRPIVDVFAPQSRDALPEQISIAHRQGHHSFESVHLRKDGTTFPAFIDITAVRGPDGQVLHRIVNVQDLSALKRAERELILLNRAINASSESAFLMDAQGRFVYVNDAACRSLGYGRDELLTMTTSDIDPYFTPEEHDKLRGELFQHGPIYGVLESQHRTRDGRVFPVDVSGAVIEHDGEKFALLTVRDITERKAAEHALQESEEKYRTLIQKIRAAVVVHAADTKILTSNAVAQEILGLSEEQMCGKTAVDPAWHFYSEDGSPVSVAEFPVNIVLASREPLRNRVFGVRRAGHAEDVWVLVNADPVFDMDGEVAQVIVTFIDVTERKRMEEELARRQEYQRTLLDNFPFFVWLKDEQSRLLAANLEYARVAKVGSPRELEGKTDFDFFPRDLAEKYVADDKAVMASGVPKSVEEPYVDEDGQRRWMETWKSPLIVNGRILGTVGFSRDITRKKRLEEELSAREREFRTLAENSPDSIIRYDREHRIRYLNSGLVRYLGLAGADEVIGKRPIEVWPDGRYAAIDEAAARAMATGGAVTIEHVEAINTGAIHYGQIIVVPERGLDGQIVGTLAIGRDVTAIREAEHRLANFIENLPGMAYTFQLSPDGHASFPFMSQAIEELYGLKPEDVKDDMAPILALAHPDDRPRIEAATAESARGMTPFRIEYRLCRPGRPERWIEARSIPEREPDGSIVWYGLLLDISERKRMEEELRYQENKFRTLAENSPNLIIRYDRDGQRIYVNPAYVDQTGISAEDALNRAPDAQVRAGMGGAAADYLAALKRVMETGKPAELFLDWRHAGTGQIASYAVQIVAERGPDGKILGALVIAHNVTALKEAERRVEESREQLRGLAARAETVREEERKRIARDMHDELGQYLTALRMGVGILRMQAGEGSEALVEQAVGLNAQVDRTIQVVRDIAASLRPAPLDMGIVSALEWLAEEFSRRTGMPCELDTDEEIQLEDKCSTAIFRIVQESLTNVVRHAQASRVGIRLKRGAGEYILAVSDNGKGFDAAIARPKSFGLVGIRERAIAFGGEVSISSAPNRGTTITVHIPVATTERE